MPYGRGRTGSRQSPAPPRRRPPMRSSYGRTVMSRGPARMSVACERLYDGGSARRRPPGEAPAVDDPAGARFIRLTKPLECRWITLDFEHVFYSWRAPRQPHSGDRRSRGRGSGRPSARRLGRAGRGHLGSRRRARSRGRATPRPLHDHRDLTAMLQCLVASGGHRDDGDRRPPWSGRGHPRCTTRRSPRPSRPDLRGALALVGRSPSGREPCGRGCFTAERGP